MNTLLTDEEFVLEMAAVLAQTQLDWERDADHVRYGGQPLHVVQARALIRRVRGETAREIERRLDLLAKEASDTVDECAAFRYAADVAAELDDPDGKG